MTNHELLQKANIIGPDARLTKKQEEAIKSLTRAEIKALIEIKQKLSAAFPPSTIDQAGVGIIEHHH